MCHGRNGPCSGQAKNLAFLFSLQLPKALKSTHYWVDHKIHYFLFRKGTGRPEVSNLMAGLIIS